MTLGAFSVSLNVRDLQASKSFYTRLGFTVVTGEEDRGWLILANGGCTIGLFQNMFKKTTLTFNPGWDQNARPLENFEDVRTLQKRFREAGIEFVNEADETTSGPASFIVVDPDGNPVLFDQHI